MFSVGKPVNKKNCHFKETTSKKILFFCVKKPEFFMENITNYLGEKKNVFFMKYWDEIKN